MTIDPIGRGSIPPGANTQAQVRPSEDKRFEQYRVQATKPKVEKDASGAEAGVTVTMEEREYFEQLFPSAAPEIKSYATYSPAGLRGKAAAGTMIDRRA